MDHNRDLNASTKSIHSGQNPDDWHSKCIVSPIVLSTTYKQSEIHASPEYYSYIGYNSPNRKATEECLSSLENAKHALCFPSGLSAMTIIGFLLKSGDHILLTRDVYHGTSIIFEECFENMGIKAQFIEMDNVDEIAANITSSTKMLWIETPTNPLLKLIDIKKTCDLAKKIKEGDIIVVVDNTFATPVFQSPLELGADLVLHSLTKYINGHSDVMAGAIMTNNEVLFDKLKFYQIALGMSPSPFDCYLVTRGIKTLHLRMAKHMDNTLKVAESLLNNPNILKVIYPALKTHPHHDLYLRQMKGCCGIISIYIKGDLATAQRFVKFLKIFTNSESLGGVESSLKHPGMMNYSHLSKEKREELGIGDNFFRLSIGIEDPNDLIQDLNQALEKALSNSANLP